MIVDLIEVQSDGTTKTLCRVHEVGGHAVFLDGDERAASLILDRTIRGEDGKPLVARDGNKFLKRLHVMVSGSRIRATTPYK